MNDKKKHAKKQIEQPADQLEVESKFWLADGSELLAVQAILRTLRFTYLHTCVIEDTLLSTDLSADTLRVRREQPLDGENLKVLWCLTRKAHVGLVDGKNVRQETNRMLKEKKAQRLITDAIRAAFDYMEILV